MRKSFSLMFIAAGVCAGAAPISAQGFGQAVAVSTGDVLVGESLNTRAPGYVYVYRNGADGWVEAQRLEAGDAAEGDHFGRALGVAGNQLLVGSTVVDNTRGAVYVFERGDDGTWTEVDKISASDAVDGDALGRSMTVSGDVALVSSWANSGSRGAVYVLRRDDSGAWAEEAKLMASDGVENDLFGFSMATDGTHAFVGAPQRNERKGGVYTFVRDDDGTWTETGFLELENAEAQAQFGASVITDHGTTMIGAPGENNFAGAVHGFALDDETGEWAETGVFKPFDGQRGTQFGASIGVRAAGEIWVGAPGAGSFEGRAYVMTWNAETSEWDSVRKVGAGELAQGDQMGQIMAFGESLVIAALPQDDFGAGTVAILERSDDGWTSGTRVFSDVLSLDEISGGEVECDDGEASIWSCADVDIVSFLPAQSLGGGRGVKLNDVWGWTDPETGREWALVGRYDGTSFVDISNPQNPVFVGNLPLHEGATPNAWRDIKVYKDHAFVVSDGAGEHGMQVFDLTQLRNVTAPPVDFEETAHYDRIHSSHNIVINEATGFAYSVGTNGGGDTCGGGLHMIDIREPTNPTFAGCFADTSTGRQRTGYSHDAMCIIYDGPDSDYRGQEVCFGANETALSIADVTDKDEPVAISMASYPNVGYSHQGWIDAEHEYFYMNDELDELGGGVSNTRTLVWDVKDLDDPILVKEHFSDNRSSDHNLYIRDNLMYQSNYVSGLRILDISDRESPEQVAFFDTVPWGEDEPGFDGSWSNYPYFESGIIVVTSGAEGVFFLRKANQNLIP